MENLLDQLYNWDIFFLLFFNSWIEKMPSLEFLFKFLAAGLVYVFPFILIIGYFWSSQAKKVMIMATLSGLFCWRVVGKLVSILYFRERPIISELVDIKEVLFHRPTYSFPSDHAMFVAALTAIFWFYGYKKLALFTAFIGSVILIMRTVVAVHYPFDIIGGILLGILISWIFFLNKKFLERYIVLPIEKIIYKIIRH